MAATFVSGVDGNGTTLSVTVAAGTNLLVVHTSTSSVTDVSVTGITYAGVAMSRLNGGVKPAGTGYFDTWILRNPTVGTANVEVTWAGSIVVSIISASMYSGVYSYSAGFTNTATDTTITTDCGTSLMPGIVEAACSSYDAIATKNADLTANQSQVNGSTRIYSSYKSVAGSAAVTVNYTCTESEQMRLNAVILYGGGGIVI